MEYFVKANYDNGSGCIYKNKSSLLEEISMMIDDCIKNGGTVFDVVVTTDASCYYDRGSDKSV